MRTVKIESLGGVGFGTRVIDAETGAPIHGVEAITVTIESFNEPVRADIRLGLVQAEIDKARAAFFVLHPVTGQPTKIKKIVFQDGSEFDGALDPEKVVLRTLGGREFKVRKPA